MGKPDLMDVKEEYRSIPKRKLSEAEKQIISLRIEKMRLEREKALLILGSGILLFLTFITIAIIGLLNGLINSNQLAILIFFGFVVLIIGISPYIRFVLKEEKALEKTLDDLIN